MHNGVYWYFRGLLAHTNTHSPDRGTSLIRNTQKQGATGTVYHNGVYWYFTANAFGFSRDESVNLQTDVRPGLTTSSSALLLSSLELSDTQVYEP